MNNMDITVKKCNYDTLCKAVDYYHEAYDRITNCKSKYLIGEKVYVEKDYFDKSNKNHITLMEIESISYDTDKKTFLYNYLYKEDELYPTEVELISFLNAKYYQEYKEKIIKVYDDLKKLNERG